MMGVSSSDWPMDPIKAGIFPAFLIRLPASGEYGRFVMTSFYQLVVKLPNDIVTDVPGINNSIVDALTENDEIDLPPESDMDPDQIDGIQQNLAAVLQINILNEWKYRTGELDCLYFFQLEKTEHHTHIHLLFDTKGVKSFVLGRYVATIKDRIISSVYGGAKPVDEDWFSISKTKPVGGTNRTFSEGYIPTYLLPKVQPELQWAWTNIDKYRLATLNLAERKRLVEEYLASLGERSDFSVGQSEGPVIKNKTSVKYMALVDWLVENGITTEKQWIRENRDSYISFNATGNSRSQIKSALDNAIKVMSLTKTAEDYLIGKEYPVDMTDNRIWKILQMNGYDPAYVGSILLGWCRRSFGKRNTVWFYGPATTGKTNIAEAISHTVPFYGCVNWTNENFPFNDCVDKMIIWWEEGKMTNKVVESAKAILGGSKVRVDQKCKSSQQIEPTPVIITSNTDMCVVIDGNMNTYEHKQPLEDRIFKIVLDQRLGPSFGKITKQEVKDFFKWSEDNQVEVEHEFNVKKAGSIPAKRKECPSEDKAVTKKPRISVADFLIQDVTVTDIEEAYKKVDWNARYQCRCDTHANDVTVNQLCLCCEFLNKGKNACMKHGLNKCGMCFRYPPWQCDVVDDIDVMDDINKEQ